jgi:hypothetical protein
MASKTVLVDSLHAGRGWPFWRTDEFSGNAALIDPQNAYASPLNAFFWLWTPLKAAGPSIWLCLLGAGIVGYLGGCALEVGVWARLLMAAASLFDFKLALYQELFPGSHWIGAVLLPLFCIAALRAIDRPGAMRASGAGLCGALCLCSGQLQLFYYCMLFLSVFALWRAAWIWKGGDSSGSRRTLGCFAGGTALAAGLSAFLLVPLAKDASQLSRASGSFDFFLSSHALSLRHLLTFLHPQALGSPLDGSYPELWEDVAYFGIVPLGLAAVGVVLSWRQPRTRQLAAAFFFSVLLALAAPLQRLLFATLPGFSLFRLPGRFFFLSGWSAMALAGLGLDEIQLRLRGLVSSAALAGGCAVLIALMTAEGSFYARRYVSMVPQDQLLPRTGYQVFFSTHAGGRIVSIGRRVLNYGWAAPMGLELVTGFGSYNYSRYQTLCDLMRWNKPASDGAHVWTDISSISRPDILDALAVRYLVSPGPLDLPRSRFVLAARLRDEPVFELYRGFSSGDVYIYENRAALPRAFFVERTVAAQSPVEAAALMEATSLRGTAIVESSDVGRVAIGDLAGDWAEAIEAYAGRLEILAHSKTERFLVVSEVWNPGWHATLDGRDFPLSRADVALMGAWLPAGEHRLILDFRPAGWDQGLAITALSAVLCVLLIILGRFGRIAAKLRRR